MTVSKANTKTRAPRKAAEADLGFHWRLANTVLLGLGVSVLVVGYVALSKGSITLAPVLLVVGYCGLIPAYLLLRGPGHDSGE